MEWRFADGKYERFPELAAELVTRQMPLGMTASDHSRRLAYVRDMSGEWVTSEMLLCC